MRRDCRFEPGFGEFMKYHWSEDYDRLLERALAEGKVQLLPDQEEQRKNPRFSLSEDLIRSATFNQRDIIDLSKSGYAFHSDKTYNIGEEAPLNLREAFQAPATVMGCEMEEVDFLDIKYRVRCKFTNPEHGMIFLLLLFEDSTIT